MNKKKLITTLGAFSLAATLTIGGTIAYLTDQKETVNKFTVGKVEIDLTEPNWKEDEHQDLQPGETIKKDPLVTNTGVNDAYVYLEVQIPMASVITADSSGNRENQGNAAEQELFTFNANSSWTQISKTSANGNMIYVYSYNQILAPEESTAPLFDTVTFANVIEGQIDLNTYDIPIEAFAIQTANTGDGSGNIPSEARAAYEKYVNQNGL